MNRRAVLQKIKRNLDMLSIPAVLDAEKVLVDGAEISYVAASIAAPMGGIDDSVSPYLGIGIAAPGKLKLKGASGEATVAAIIDSELRLKVLAVMLGFANNVLVHSNADALLAEIPGHVDLQMMGS
jgi:hypothetical protein